MPISCADEARFIKRSDQDIFDTVDFLREQEGHLTKTKFQKLTTLVGVGLPKDGILQRPSLRGAFKPMTALRFDPFHIWWSNGIVQQEVWLLLGRLAVLKVHAQHLDISRESPNTSQ